MAISVNSDSRMFYWALVSASASILILPVQATVLVTLLSHPELRRNASYQILARLIVCEIFQSIALIFTGVFVLFPGTQEIGGLYVYACLTLSCVFLAGFPLMCELSVFRILVFMKKCSPNQLPTPIIIFECVSWLLILSLAVAVYLTTAMSFDGYTWVYAKNNTVATVLNLAELYFCIPMIVITYSAYLVLVFLIYGTRKYSLDSNAKQEWILFLQSSFVTFYYILLILNWHVIEPLVEEEFSAPLAYLTSLTWATSYYWTSVLLLCFNKTVSSKLCRFEKKTVFLYSGTR